MKRILPVFLIGTALTLVTSGLRAQNGGKQPNFIVILGEGAGWNSTPVPMDDTVPGSKSDLLQTPNLARIASEGMRFANFYAASARCTPSRAAIFTGKSPAQLHMTFINVGRRRDASAAADLDARWSSPSP